MKMIKNLMLISAIAGFLTTIGCEKGSAEKAGEKLDKAAEKTADAAKDAGDALKDAVKK
ncbi:MAG: hypothetical protein ABIQ35_14235 [Verrucomicrobiota bacterium]